MHRLTGQPLTYAPKHVQVQRNTAATHQPTLSRKDANSAYSNQHVQNLQRRTSERINIQAPHYIQLGTHETGTTCMVGNRSIHYQPHNLLDHPRLYTHLM